jgi:hypothetical protein
MKKKIFIIVVSILSICSFLIGTSVAWLSSKTDEVINTFTYGDINIKIEETDTGDNDNNEFTNSYKMLPGNKITKDPKITVLANSEDSYLFVEIKESENFKDFMKYELVEGWTLVEGTENVYVREVTKSDKDQEFFVLKDNTVTVLESVTKAMLNDLDKDGQTNYPTLSFTAYAVQRDSKIEAIDTAAEAWSIVSSNNQ